MPADRLADALLCHDGGHALAPGDLRTPSRTRADVSFDALRARVTGVASALRARGARVVLLSAPNGDELVASLLGALEAGAAALLLPADFPDAALAGAARAARADFAIAAPGDARFAALSLPVASEEELLAERAPAGVSGPEGAVLLPTSGTTGASRLVRRSARALRAVAFAGARGFGLTPADRVALAVPLCHSYGLDLMLATLAAGACAQLHASFQLGALRRALRDDGVSVFPGVPVMLDALSRGERLVAPALRRVLSAGSPLPLRVFERFRDVSGLAVGQFYGATEFGAVAYNDPASHDFDPLSVGTPLGDARFRIVAVEDDASGEAAPLPVGAIGRIAVASATLFDGYADGPSPARGGWFTTGDLGALDARGRLRLHGRTALLIDVGGKKVNPAEVERVLALHPDVREAVVLPEADRDTVTRVLAIVVPEPDVRPEPEKLRAFAREHLPPHMLPRRIVVCEEPPRAANGKILRAQLAAAIGRA